MNSIYLLPLIEVEKELTEALVRPLQKAFHAEIAGMNAAVDMQSFYDEQRHQYNSTEILRYMREHFSNNHLLSPKLSHSKAYLAIAAQDLFIPILTYVFGEAELDGDIAVVSYYRLQNERYGLPPDRTLLVERLQKEAIHELGHAFGLVHCQTQACVMHTSTYVEDIDLKGIPFCDICLKILQRSKGRT